MVINDIPGHQKDPGGEAALIPNANVALPSPPTDRTPPTRDAWEPQQHLTRTTVLLLVVASFGGGMAMVVPMAFTLALKLNQLASGREEFLGYILGAGSLCALLAAPLTGILSDRTRSRWGRRRPYAVIGAAVGLAAAPLMAFAPNIPVLGFGWVLSTVGWGTVVGSIGNFQADNLPAAQRGSVSGLTGLTMQVAPVIGIMLVGTVTASALWVFLLPAGVGTLLIAAFVIFAPEKDSRGQRFASPLSAGTVFRSFGFNPRKHPSFAWVWAGRFLFFLGLSLTTSFATFFYAQRLEIDVADVTTVIAVIAGASIVSATVGAIGGGWLSDHMARRKPFIMLGTLLFAVGALVSAFSYDLALLLIGSFISSTGIAVFTSVGQALILDVLPHGNTQVGRFMAITSFSQKIPSALAPLLAPVLFSISASGNDKNYTVLFLAAGVLAVSGGLLTVLRVRKEGA
ncbi:MFS transporter [Arthrobacter rhizosphaerae]|uniref:MFS transporter n=1 Tax=Arthrobacter rhizosphaerae TaxID=2855490 RepID=UPI001FF1B280|nr:MFS transporter [Arthrobacter rhizosphaerae]